MRRISYSPARSFLISVSSYAASIGLSILLTYFLASDQSQLVQVLIADLLCTVFIFACSYRFNNSSLYDPYWSLIPIFIALYYYYFPGEQVDLIRSTICVVLVWMWGIRLTHNFFRGWPGLQHEDYRYVSFRNSFPKLYWLISFSGIHLFPTLMVFSACIPLYFAMSAKGIDFGLLDLLGLIIAFTGIWLEFTADNELRKFVKKRREKGEVLQEGIWGIVRNPNYLGEILFWYGIAVIGFSASGHWWLFSGAVAMNVMFVIVSIPMKEKRMKTKEEWEAYKKKVPRWLPFL